MSSGDQTALAALIGVAALVGFAAVLVPVLDASERDRQARQQFSIVETFVVMAALGAAIASVITSVDLLQADRPLRHGIPSTVWVPVFVAVLLLAALGVLARSPGGKLHEVVEAALPRLAMAIVALILGTLSAVISLGAEGTYWWASGIVALAVVIGLFAQRLNRALNGLITKLFGRFIPDAAAPDGTDPGAQAVEDSG